MVICAHVKCPSGRDGFAPPLHAHHESPKSGLAAAMLSKLWYSMLWMERDSEAFLQGTMAVAFGILHVEICTWHLTLGTWHLALGTWHLEPDGTCHLTLDNGNWRLIIAKVFRDEQPAVTRQPDYRRASLLVALATSRAAAV